MNLTPSSLGMICPGIILNLILLLGMFQTEMLSRPPYSHTQNKFDDWSGDIPNGWNSEGHNYIYIKVFEAVIKLNLGQQPYCILDKFNEI